LQSISLAPDIFHDHRHDHSQYTRQLRMERAAELLKSGKFNVTDAALEVGYSSMSHFSQTFHETFGCCPGLYPLRTPAQTLHSSD
jgi:AraC-like DNA-binding protein